MSVLWIEFDLTNEPTLLPVAPHSEGCEFSQEIVKYRGIVEEVMFDCFGRPSFFGEVVEVQRRVGETLKHLNPNIRTEEEFRWLIQVEARLLAREMEVQFSQTGILGALQERAVKLKRFMRFAPQSGDRNRKISSKS